jgi:hypothetical protein
MSQQDPDSLTQGEVYDLLSNARRRFVISYLRDREEPVELNALSREVAAWENETAVEDLTDQQIKRVYVSLYQTHIPKLDESGVVDYDKDSGMVDLAGNVRALDTYLPNGDRPDVPWQFVYAAIAVVGLTAFGLVTAFPTAFAWVSIPALGAVLMASFGVVAIAHYLYGDQP